MDVFCLLHLSVGSQKRKAQIVVWVGRQTQKSAKFHQKVPLSVPGWFITNLVPVTCGTTGWSVGVALAKTTDVGALIP